MSRPIAMLLIGALTVLPHAALAEDGRYDNPPRTQQDMARDREHACRGLKGDAYAECIADYVGPKRDRAGTGGWKRPGNPQKSHGRA